jgi:DNA polymerase-1
MLFDRMKLPVVRTTDAGHRSTDEATLAALADREPWVAGLLEMRKVQKLKGTYADGLLEKIRPDGRIHASFNVDGAASGRTSSSNPNLQNIPTAASPEGKMARDLFVAPLGWVILSVDYSQLELRVMAMLSRDPVMTADFKSGLDIHRQTAASIFKVAPEDVTDKQRKIAKTIVFGLAYGKSDENFADDLGVSIAEARRYREGILGRYQRFAQWQTSLWKEAQAAGLSWTWWAGRRARRRQLWRAGNEQDRQAFAHARNQTMNTPVQGTASEFCVASLIECVRWIRDEDVPARVTMAVHDELDFEVREDALPWVAKRVRQIMLSHDSAGVPLAVDLEFGKSWGSLEPYKEPQGDAEHDSRGPKGPSR